MMVVDEATSPGLGFVNGLVASSTTVDLHDAVGSKVRDCLVKTTPEIRLEWPEFGVSWNQASAVGILRKVIVFNQACSLRIAGNVLAQIAEFGIPSFLVFQNMIERLILQRVSDSLK